MTEGFPAYDNRSVPPSRGRRDGFIASAAWVNIVCRKGPPSQLKDGSGKRKDGQVAGYRIPAESSPGWDRRGAIGKARTGERCESGGEGIGKSNGHPVWADRATTELLSGSTSYDLAGDDECAAIKACIRSYGISQATSFDKTYLKAMVRDHKSEYQDIHKGSEERA